MYVHAFQSFCWNEAASRRVTAHGAEAVVAGDLVVPRGALLEARAAAAEAAAAAGGWCEDAALGPGAAGATLVMNPTANLKLATGGIFPYRGARRAGVRVCLGTDGAASNNNLDMLEEMKMAALLQKHREEDATVLPAAEALAMATEVPAGVFGHGTGRLEVGAPADLVLMDLSGPSTQPLHDPASALVYAANASHVHTTICAGRVLMHNGKVEDCDPDEVMARAREVVRNRL
jgi:5-methylthioadenosine/S-adenosylhomocysteine deaminase